MTEPDPLPPVEWGGHRITHLVREILAAPSNPPGKPGG